MHALTLLSLYLSTFAPTDQQQVELKIRDYIEGYYQGNAERVRGALYKDLAKRVVVKRKDGTEIIHQGSAEKMIELTAAQDGPKSYPRGKQRLAIQIFEIDRNIATAKAIAQDWVDYIHLCKVEGNWTIVNVVWRPTS